MIPHVASKGTEFLLDTGATYSVLTQHSGPRSQHSCTVTGIDGWLQVRQLTCLPACGTGSLLLSQSFLLVAKCLTPLLGSNLLAKPQTAIQIGLTDANAEKIKFITVETPRHASGT